MKHKYMQNRELSWLKFNERVLEKGNDVSIPLFERLKFVSIFDSNLSEFFNVRVGSLTNISLMDKKNKDSRTGMTVEEQLDAIYKETIRLYKKRDEIYCNLEAKFKSIGVGNLKYNELNEEQKLFINSYYEKEVAPMMSPNVVDKRHPFPFLENNLIYIIAELETKKRDTFLILPVREALPKFIKLPNSNHYILMEEIFYTFVNSLVPDYEVKNKYVIRVTRNADVDLEQNNDEEIDYLEYVQNKLKNRRILSPVRLETSSELSNKAKDFLISNLGLKEYMIFSTCSPLKMKYVWSLPRIINPSLLGDITFEKYKPRMTNMLSNDYKYMDQIEDHDVFLSYPYEDMGTFIKILSEASVDPRVFSIKITLYRMASNSKVIKYLLRAAEEGKEVSVIVELRARFDEENNIDYSEELIQSGINVIYGIENYKVHTKICLISYIDKDEVKYITHVGTGNYNESTAKIYQDMNIITADQEIGIEANQFFNNLQLNKVNNNYNHLIQSPSTLKPKIMELMDREILKGSENGYIRLKCNSVTDKDIIKKIVEASQAGVKVDLIVRGICCILPGIEGYTENVTVRSLVGRYLEHARIYEFGKDEFNDVYIASADLMTRNTQRRVELGYPVFNADIKRYLIEFLDNQFRDNVNGKELMPNGEYKEIKGEKFDSHRYYMDNVEDYLLREYKPKKILYINKNTKTEIDSEIDNSLNIKEKNSMKRLSLWEKIKLFFGIE